MRTIYKFEIEFGNDTHIELPSDAKLLHVDVQSERVMVWFEVDKEKPLETRVFNIFGTGHSIREGFEYCGTALVSPFVWHVYELQV